jgi:hypothetical protein
MEAQRTGKNRANALTRGEIVVTARDRSGASPEQVYDVLADLSSHAIWGGERQKEKTRLVQVDAPAGQATVGVEFETVGADLIGRFDDRSVVTEATRPGTFEFVTEAVLTTKKGERSEWTLVHRYELAPVADGCEIVLTTRIVRISRLIGPMKLFEIPLISKLVIHEAAAAERRGVKNLARYAEERH